MCEVGRQVFENRFFTVVDVVGNAALPPRARPSVGRAFYTTSQGVVRKLVSGAPGAYRCQSLIIDVRVMGSLVIADLVIGAVGDAGTGDGVILVKHIGRVGRRCEIVHDGGTVARGIEIVGEVMGEITECCGVQFAVLIILKRIRGTSRIGH